jgi:hypothetical protein
MRGTAASKALPRSCLWGSGSDSNFLLRAHKSSLTPAGENCWQEPRERELSRAGNTQQPGWPAPHQGQSGQNGSPQSTLRVGVSNLSVCAGSPQDLALRHTGHEYRRHTRAACRTHHTPRALICSDPSPAAQIKTRQLPRFPAPPRNACWTP